MAKMTSLSGSVTGKLAGNVYSVSAGQQIVRAYQPNVANPSTELQVSNRTKFKLASQLAAAVSPVLAIPKNGLVSGRNQFVSETMDAIRFALGEATIILPAIQLTKSTLELPSLQATRAAGGGLELSLSRDATHLGVTKVVYAIFVGLSNVNKLELVASQVVSVAGDAGTFPTSLASTSNRALMIYAYGIIEEENNVLAKYGNYQVDDAQFIATLISSRSGAASGLKTTTTKYATVEAVQ